MDAQDVDPEHTVDLSAQPLGGAEQRVGTALRQALRPHGVAEAHVRHVLTAAAASADRRRRARRTGLVLTGVAACLAGGLSVGLLAPLGDRIGGAQDTLAAGQPGPAASSSEGIGSLTGADLAAVLPGATATGSVANDWPQVAGPAGLDCPTTVPGSGGSPVSTQSTSWAAVPAPGTLTASVAAFPTGQQAADYVSALKEQMRACVQQDSSPILPGASTNAAGQDV